MDLDEIIYSAVLKLIKKRKDKRSVIPEEQVHLNDIRTRLKIIATAFCNTVIEIYDAEREGGYKGDVFFLPVHCNLWTSSELNFKFYLFRTIYLAVQRNLRINWFDEFKHSDDESRLKAYTSSNDILTALFAELPKAQNLHAELVSSYPPELTEKSDWSWLYGKCMNDQKKQAPTVSLSQITDVANGTPNGPENVTTIKAKATEQLDIIQIDKKAQEDYVLTHNFEKVETAEEFSGNWRDFDGDDSLADHQDALRELNLNLAVRVDDPVHSIYESDFKENTHIAQSEKIEDGGHFIPYPEWDYQKKIYRPEYCKLYPAKVDTPAVKYYHDTIQQHQALLRNLKKSLANINSKSRMQRRQVHGDEFDTDAVIDHFVDVVNKTTPNDKIYFSPKKLEKELSLLLLLDLSLSSDGYAGGNHIIDVSKQVSILFGELLHEFSIDFSIHGFYSKTRNYSHYITLKDFDEPWLTSRLNIGAVAPMGYTRIGTALRHSRTLLNERDAKKKWLIFISDGKPNDYDRYEGKYGIQDVKKALSELKKHQINYYSLAIESAAKYYLPQMFGTDHYKILSSPVELLQAMVVLYERIKYGA